MTPSVLICTPTKSGFVHVNYLLSLMHSIQVILSKGMHFSLFFDVGKSGIDIPRSQAATYFLNSNHTHLMFVDDDMAWQPEIIARMVELDCDIVGVPYRQKDHEVIYNMRSAKDIEQSTENPSLLNVHDIATGLLLIKKCVFEKLKDTVDVVIDNKTKENIYMFFRHEVVSDPIAAPDGGMSYMSEDLYFCRMARQNGFQVWAYIDAETAHTGITSFRGNYADVLEGITKEKFRDTTPKQQLRLTGAIDG